MPDREIKEVYVVLSHYITIKDLKIKLAEESGIPWEELIILE
jgi:hypothetical protein